VIQGLTNRMLGLRAIALVPKIGCLGYDDSARAVTKSYILALTVGQRNAGGRLLMEMSRIE
jgi:hypothetical protein